MSTPTEDPISFSLLEEKYCVAQLPLTAEVPKVLPGTFFSVTVTSEEISVVCEESSAPAGALVERHWRCLKVKGPLEFALKGVLVSILKPLADAGIAVFAISTYNTDFILVQQYFLTKAIETLEASGHKFLSA